MKLFSLIKPLTAGALMSLALSAAADVKVAYIDPLSGPFANVGEVGFQQFLAGAEMVNARGGVAGQKLVMVSFDNKGSPQESLINFKNITDQGIRYITQGNGSGVAHALVDAVNKWNERNPDKTVLYLNYAAVDPTLTNDKCSFWHFRFDAHSDMKMNVITDYMSKDKAIKSVFILGQDYAHGHQVAKAAKEMLASKRPDVKIVGEDLHPIGRVKDFSPYIAKIKASGADTVITGNWGNDLSLLIKAAKDADLKARFFTYYAGGLGTPSAMGEAGAGRVLQLTEWHRNIPLKQSKQLADDLDKKMKTMYPAPHPEFYYLRVNTMLLMLADAMNKAKSVEPKDVALALEDMRYASDVGEVWMRKADHQLMQPLHVSVFGKVDGKDIKRDVEGTGHGFKNVLSVSQKDTVLPTTCKMERPK